MHSINLNQQGHLNYLLEKSSLLTVIKYCFMKKLQLSCTKQIMHMITRIMIVLAALGFFGTTAFSQITSTTPASRCGEGSLVLHATGSGTIKWYTVPFYGTPITDGISDGGATFTTPSLPVTTTYYVDALDAGECSLNPGSVRVPVIATISASSIQASIFYSSETFCKSVIGEQPVTRTGTAGGTFTVSPAGLTLNATSGAITPSSSAVGTYTVTYTVVAAEGCIENPASTDATITIAPEQPEISYTGSPYCTSNSAVSVNRTGAPGGTYNASPSGLNIHSTSGTITPAGSLSGTYTITYFVPGNGGCLPLTATSEITILKLPTAIISYGSPFTKNMGSQSVTLTGTGVYSGGTYTKTGTGTLSLNPSTGAIDPSTSDAGTYTIIYTLAAVPPCAEVTASTSVTIYGLPTATITGTQSVCQNSTSPDITFSGASGLAPYTFVYKINGGYDQSVTTTSGNSVTVSHPTSVIGTYAYTLVSVSDAHSSSQTQTGTATITISASPVASFNYEGTPYCSNGSNPLPTFLEGGVAGIFSSTSGLNFISTSTGQINLASSTPGTYTVTNTIAAAAGCPEVTATTSVTINALPVATFNYAGTPYCNNAVNPVPTFTGGGVAGLFTAAPAGLSFISVTTGQIDLTTSVAGTYTVTNTIAAANGCEQVTATSVIIITTAPVQPTITYSGVFICTSSDPLSVTQTGTIGGIYTVFPEGLSINSATGIITPSTSTAGAYTVTYTIAAAGGCAELTATYGLTITELPHATIEYSSLAYCANDETPYSVTLTGTTGGIFSSLPAGLSMNAAGTITPGTSTAGEYTVTYTIAAAGGCVEVVATTVVTITTPPTATISYAGSPFCMNLSAPQSVTLSGTGFYNPTNAYFSSTSGLTLHAGTGEITPSTSTAGDYTVTYTIPASGGCAQVQAQTPVRINPLPTPSISGPATVCALSTGNVYSTANVVGHTYEWAITGGTITAGDATNSITVTWNAAGTGTLTVKETITATGCNVTTAAYNITINPLPTPEISGATTVCALSTGNVYSTANVVGHTYVWNITGGTITAGDATNSITVTWNAAGTGTLTVKETITATGCNITTATYNVTINPLPAPAISGATTVCALSTGNVYSTADVVGHTYVWTITGGTITAGDATNSITVTWNAAGTGTLTVKETITATGCNITTATYNVTINPLPAPAISGAATVCALSTGNVYSTANVVGHTYEWAITGGTITAGDATNSITVTWNAAGTGTLTVKETITATGCNVTTATYNVTINPLPTPAISGAATVCALSTGNVYSTANVVGHTYEWAITGGTITAGDATNSITVTWNAAGTGTLTVKETITATGCNVTTAAYNITINPLPTPEISGATTVCALSTGNVYSTANVVGHTYVWNITGGTITAGDATNSITVTWNAAGTGTLTVKETITATGCNITTATYNVTINPLPAPAISGATTVCALSTGNVYSTADVVGHTYIWTITGGTITAGDATNSIIVTWNAAGTGTLTVKETITATGCNVTTAAYNITINPLPTATIGGTTTVCKNAAAPDVTFTGAAGTAPYTFTYSINGGSNQTISTTSGNSVMVSAPTATAGTYTYVLITVQDGSSTVCSQTQTGTAVITVDPTTVAGTVGGSAAVCTGTNSTILTLSGNTGSIVKWQYSIDNFVSDINDVSNVTTTITATNLTVTTYYRAVVQSGVCSPANSTVGIVTVVPDPTISTQPAATTTECTGGTAQLNVVAANGTGGYTYQWYSNTTLSNSGGTLISGATTDVYTPATTSAGTFFYYVVVGATGDGCGTATSDVATVIVNQTPDAPTGAATQTFCAGATVADLVVATGTNIKWYDAASEGTVVAGTTVLVNGTIYYASQATALGCESVARLAVTATVYPATAGGAITGSSIVCEGTNSTLLTLTGATGDILRWESSPTGTTWTNIANTLATYTATNLTVDMQYRAVVQSGTCNSAYSVVGTVAVNPAPVPFITAPETGGLPRILDGATITGQVYSTLIGMTNYVWAVSSAGTITAGQGTDIITVTWTLPTSQQFVSVSYTDASGCPALAPTVKIINYYPFADALDPALIPKFVDPLPHFAAGLRVDAKAGGNLTVKQVLVQQIALPTGTVLAGGATIGTSTPTVGLGNYAAYQISYNGGSFGPAMWPAQTIEAQVGNQLIVQYQNKLNGVKFSNFNILADQTLMGNGYTLTGDPLTSPYTGDIPMVVHLHGGEMPSNSDGGPTAWFTPDFAKFGPGFAHAASSLATYPNQQEEGTLWYHPHDQGLTRTNVYTGLAGFYFLRGPNEEAAQLPGWSGDDKVQEVTPAGKVATFNGTNTYLPEIEVAIQDRMFNTSGELYWPVAPTNPEVHPFWTPEFFGDVMTVNGKAWPYLSVAPRKYRFRLLDGCNARFLNVWLQDLTTAVTAPAIKVIGSDGALLDAPATLGSTLLMAPGERYDVVIDFTGIAEGTVFTMMNNASGPYPVGDPVAVGTTDRIMQFVVNGLMKTPGGGAGTDKSLLPGNIRPVSPMVKLTDFAGNLTSGVVPAVKRQIILNEVSGAGGPIQVLFNNSHFDNSSPIPGAPLEFGGPTEIVAEGSTEQFTIINTTVDAHPIHIHLTQWQLVSRQTFDVAGYMASYVAAWAGNGSGLPAWPAGWLLYPGGSGSPLAYNAPNTDGAVGGNPAITPFLTGSVIPATPEERVWKDNIKSFPGEVATYIVRFAPTDRPIGAPASALKFPFDPSAGPGYVWHCHIIDHEDMDMMRPLMVTASGTAQVPQITVQPLPAVVCDGAVATYTVTGTSARTISYLWQVNNGTGWTNLTNVAPYSGVLTNTLSINPAALALTTYQYRVNLTNMDGTTTSNAALLTVNPLPAVAAIAGGAVNVCVGTATPAFTNATAGGTWSIVPGTGTASVDAGRIVTGLTVGTVTVKYTTAADGNGCINSATAALTVNAFPTLTTITGLASVCAGETGAIYSVTDEVGHTYAWTVVGGTITAGDATNSITVTWGAGASGTVDVTETITASGCSKAASQKVVTITAIPSAPTGDAAQTFCSITNPTLLNIVVTGGTIIWYDAPTGGNILPSSTALVTATTYYAGQVVPGCGATSATRLAVTVTVNTTPVAPTGAATQTFCAGATVADLVATGTAISWHSAATAGSVLPGTTALVDGTIYYASQTVLGCQSDIRLEVTATVHPIAGGIITGSAIVCEGTNSTLLTLVGYTGTIVRWESSPNGTTWTNIANTLATYTATNLTVDMQYRAVVQSGTCSQNSVIGTVAVNPAPVPFITAPETGGLPRILDGATITGQVYSTLIGMTNYVWAVSSAGTITAGQGTDIITVTWTLPTSQQFVSVSYTDAFGCPALAPTVKIINYYPFAAAIDPAVVPKFVDPMPHFAAGLRVNAKAGGSLLVKEQLVQQIALPTGTVLSTGTIGTSTPTVGLGNYAVYAVSTNGGTSFGPAMWPAQTIEAQQGNQLTVQYRNDLTGVKYSDFNILADQTLMGNGYTLTGDPLTSPYTGDIPMVVHLHGGEMPSNSDGGPTAWFTPGYALLGPGFANAASSLCTYPNQQEEGTLWYHPHDQGLTRINVYTGLAGFYFLRGPHEEAAHLPGWSGDDKVQEVTPAGKVATFNGTTAYLPEIEIGIQDRMFNTKGEAYWPVTPTNPEVHPFWTPEFFGDVMVVNGKAWPYLSVAPRKYRFRILNGCNARFLNMWLKDTINTVPVTPPNISILGSDGALMNHPATIDMTTATLLMAPAERYDVIIDFTGIPAGTKFVLMNNANGPYPDGDPVIPGLTDRIMEFVVNGVMKTAVGGDGGTDNSTLPANIRPAQPMVELTDFAGGLTAGVTPTVKRQLLLNEVSGAGGPIQVLFNNSHFDTSGPIPGAPPEFGGPTEIAAEGTTELISIINTTIDAHPIHIHLTNWQLVSRQAFNVTAYMAAYEGAWATAQPAVPKWPAGWLNYPGGAGSPYSYNTPNTDGAVGGNPAISGFVTGSVIPASPQERVWKDDVTALPGEVSTFIVRFAPTDLPIAAPVSALKFPFDPSAGPGYVWHCHIIDHEDMDMMRPLMVTASGTAQVPQITVQPLPAVACDGGIATYTVTATSARTISYQWQISVNAGVAWTNLANGAPYSGVLTNTLSINPAALALTTYQYRVNLTNMDGTTTSNAALLTVNPLPSVAAIAGGAVNVCVGTATPAFTNATAGGTWSIVPGTGTASVDAGRIVTGLTVGTVTVKYTTAADGNGCINSATTALTVLPLAQGSLTANGPFCVTGAGQLTWTATTGTGPYTVIYNDGTADRTASSVSSGTPFDVFTTPVTATTTYTLVSVQDANCIRSTGFTGNTATITINALPSAPGGVASQFFCAPATVANLTATGTGLKWYDAPTAGTLYLSTDALVNGNLYYASQTVNGCESATRFVVTATVYAAVPATPGAITGAPSPAAASSQPYSITAVTDATSYTWTVPAGWTISGGQGTNSITVTVGATGDNGNITVTATNVCGTSSAQTLAVTVP